MSAPSNNVERLILELNHAGRNAIAYLDEDRNSDRPFTLHTYRPYGYTPDRPVVIVQHGVLRNGDEYRDFWIPAADKHKLLIVAPTFSNEIWPGVESYNNGRVFTPGGNVRPVDGWTYVLPQRVFADLREAEITTTDKAYLFGHSAGGQFVHRLMSSQSHEPYKAVTAGNPGWYTLPTFDHPYPEGLDGVGLTEDHLARLLAYPLTVLAGDQDIATSDPNLPSEPAAMRQGPHRYARAHHYFEAGRREAERRGLPFNWRLVSVPGIGHDGKAMSAVCASLWFDGGMPDDATMAALAGKTVA
ncbi:alpha/beta hydrolase [Bordetella genomosp. 10]|uniref:Alpha/beta hydrolase n=1 Tax=Bordetella genomosp. 10 TaxID=1416804 RepID=A0A261S484_9BORD|nr:alpha/beta hydrolase [Bordetella genomosp. 10]OZI31807.1 alpha/beta hydrolase [Bordetella genomosp. 10]